MARYKVYGLDEYDIKLSEIESLIARGELAGAAIYAGAKVAADAIHDAIEELPVTEEGYARHGSEKHKLETITKRQKEGLLEGLGIAKMQETNGIYHEKVGFHGYNKVKTKQHPGGQPNAMIARTINSGTSFRRKTRFVDKATKKAKPEAEKAMAEAFDRKLAEIVK